MSKGAFMLQIGVIPTLITSVLSAFLKTALYFLVVPILIVSRPEIEQVPSGFTSDFIFDSICVLQMFFSMSSVSAL